MKKLVFLEADKEEEKYLNDHLKNLNLSLSFLPDPISEESISKIKDANIIGLFIYSKVTKDILQKIPNLEYITTMSTGFDHIDINACKNKGIKVSNVPNYSDVTVSEHAVSLMLALARRLPESFERIEDSIFSPEGLRGFELNGKTLGIIGCGGIGKNVAKIARGFGMKVISYDPYPDKEFAEKEGVEFKKLSEVLSSSDIITLHAPYNEKTHHLINKENIKDIKKGAYLINTARGGLIETDALVEAIKGGILAGAGLDVLEEESFIKDERELLAKPFKEENDLRTALQDHFLMEDDRVIVTPHNAFNSNESFKRILDTTVENIKSFLKGSPQNTVN